MNRDLQAKIAMRREIPGCNLSGMSTFADRLISARKDAGLNQSELARLLGVTPQAVQKWESGENIPRGKRIHFLASHLKVSAEYLLSGRDPLALHARVIYRGSDMSFGDSYEAREPGQEKSVLADDRDDDRIRLLNEISHGSTRLGLNDLALVAQLINRLQSK